MNPKCPNCNNNLINVKNEKEDSIEQNVEVIQVRRVLSNGYQNSFGMDGARIQLMNMNLRPANGSESNSCNYYYIE